MATAAITRLDWPRRNSAVFQKNRSSIASGPAWEMVTRILLCWLGDIGCYGVDTGPNPPNLLKKSFALGNDFRILLWDLNIRWFINYYDEFRSVLKANSRRVSRIVLPIESGSDRILGLMNRGYKIEKVKECLLDS